MAHPRAPMSRACRRLDFPHERLASSLPAVRRSARAVQMCFVHSCFVCEKTSGDSSLAINVSPPSLRQLARGHTPPATRLSHHLPALGSHERSSDHLSQKPRDHAGWTRRTLAMQSRKRESLPPWVCLSSCCPRPAPCTHRLHYLGTLRRSMISSVVSQLHPRIEMVVRRGRYK